jgi:protein dithiol oxidoreductase (disulfide-forming)
VKAIAHLVWPLGLLLLAACGGGDIDSDRVVDAANDRPATLAPDAAPDGALFEQDDDEPTSARFQLGAHYERLSPTQPTSSEPGQVEVAEIFWYGCPHCLEFEPYLARFEDQKPGYVNFIRIPAVWNDMLRLHARAFYTAEVLGKGEEMHDAFFAEIHRNRNPLDSRQALAELFARFGVDAAAFDEAFDSFDVHTKLQRADELNRRYRVTSVPSIVVNGKYTTNASLAGSYEQLIELIGELVAAERPGG